MSEVLPFRAPLKKRCTKCGVDKVDSIDNFYRQRQGRKGLSAECRDCKKRRMKKINRRFYEANRDQQMIRSYSQADKKAGRLTDLPIQWFKENISSKPCSYCGTTDDPIGADRLDNAVGHIRSNVVPCCKLCNKTRNSHFSPREMKMIGVVIAKIRKARKQFCD